MGGVTVVDLRVVSPALAGFFDEMCSRVGRSRVRRLGVVTDVMIRRYAVAVGDFNPIYHDREVARAHGFDDIVAPPNFLGAVLDWGPGVPEGELGADGVPVDSYPAPEGPVRVLGAGEQMELLEPVVAGMEIVETSTVEDVVSKRGRSGVLVFVTVLHEFATGDGRVLNRNRRTAAVRPFE